MSLQRVRRVFHFHKTTSLFRPLKLNPSPSSCQRPHTTLLRRMTLRRHRQKILIQRTPSGCNQKALILVRRAPIHRAQAHGHQTLRWTRGRPNTMSLLQRARWDCCKTMSIRRHRRRQTRLMCQQTLIPVRRVRRVCGPSRPNTKSLQRARRDRHKTISLSRRALKKNLPLSSCQHTHSTPLLLQGQQTTIFRQPRHRTQGRQRNRTLRRARSDRVLKATTSPGVLLARYSKADSSVAFLAPVH